MNNDSRLKWISEAKKKSENDRKSYEYRWVRNIKLSKGIPLEDKSTKSEVRGRTKTYFRKIWSVVWRLVASFYNAFLRDSADAFKVIPVDTTEDPRKAAVLSAIMKYRYRQMLRKDSLFLKHIWSFFDIGNLGICCGKLCWEYTNNSDRPRFISYPPEQVFPDFTADTKSDMRHCTFVNYISKDEMEDKGYKNLENAQPIKDYNQVRAVRNAGYTDPIQNPAPNEYPSAGRYAEGKTEEQPHDLFEVWETFYKENGKWKLAITHAGQSYAKEPIDSPYGDWMPLIWGVCLTEPHRLTGEGFPESMEGPQESYNFNLNARKDNVALSLRPPTIVSRHGGVDMNALTNRRAGGIVLADDAMQTINPLKVEDATQSSYAEAQQDIGMMEDVSGVSAAVQGLANNDTATEANINLSQGTAKLDLYTGIIAETYFADFISGLGYLCQRFETDEKVFKICHDELYAATGVDHSGVYDIDFEADFEITTNQNVGKENEIRQSLLILDRGAMYNQQQLSLLQMNAVPKEGIKLFNGLAVFEDVLKVVGKKDFNRYWVSVPAPPTIGSQLARSMQVDNGALSGLAAPQPGPMANLQPPNELQGGSIGGL